MATTRLSDAVIPAVYAGYAAEDSPENTAFFDSGVIVRNPLLDEKANTGGQEIQIPFWRDLDASVEPNASNDPSVLPAEVTRTGAPPTEVPFSRALVESCRVSDPTST